MENNTQTPFFPAGLSQGVSCATCAHRKLVGHEKWRERFHDAFIMLSAKVLGISDRSGGYYFCSAFGRGKPSGIARCHNGVKQEYTLFAGRFAGLKLEGRMYPLGSVINAWGNCPDYKPAPPGSLQSFLKRFQMGR